MYPEVFFDTLYVNIRDGVTVKKMPVHIAIGIDARGMREVLGMWTAENEGAPSGKAYSSRSKPVAYKIFRTPPRTVLRA